MSIFRRSIRLLAIFNESLLQHTKLTYLNCIVIEPTSLRVTQQHSVSLEIYPAHTISFSYYVKFMVKWVEEVEHYLVQKTFACCPHPPWRPLAFSPPPRKTKTWHKSATIYKRCVLMLCVLNPCGLWRYFFKTSEGRRKKVYISILFLKIHYPMQSWVTSTVHGCHWKNQWISSFSCISRQSLNCTCYTEKNHAFLFDSNRGKTIQMAKISWLQKSFAIV